MHSFLEWFRLEEFIPIVLIAFILIFVGQQMVTKNAGIERKAGWFSVLAFFLYAGMGLSVSGVEDHTEVVLTSIRASLASGVAFGIGMIAFSLIVVMQNLIEQWRSIPQTNTVAKPVPEVIEAVPKPVKPSLPKPPPPTREELAAEALKKHEERLAVIASSRLDETAAKAARAHAQQQYTKEIDGVMK